MPKKWTKKEWDFMAQQVAWLLTEGKKKPREIVSERILDVSEATVTRLKNWAIENKWLVTTTCCSLDKEQKRRVTAKHLPLAESVRSRLGEGTPSGVRDIWVFDSGSEATEKDEHESRLQRFGKTAAARLDELLPRMGTVGVTWGNTIGCLIRALGERFPNPPSEGKPTIFVPLSGVLLNDPSISLSSTSLVAQFHRIVNGKDSTHLPLSLGAAPARIPYRFQATKRLLTREEKKAIEALTHDIRGYRIVFLGGKEAEEFNRSLQRSERGPRRGNNFDPQVNRLDSLITSVGCDYSKSKDPWLDELSTREELSPSDLDRLTHGDIGGVFIPKDGISNESMRKLNDINSRWLGSKVEVVRGCAEYASEKETPGVILVAVGKRKARIVTECVRKGLVNQLIIDYDLAKAIVDLPDSPKS
jgi:DNA-binding transcriptional regulator LsrR (DeoR family)